MYLVDRGVAKELPWSDRPAQDDHEAERRPHDECRRPSSRYPPLPPNGDRRSSERDRPQDDREANQERLCNLHRMVEKVSELEHGVRLRQNAWARWRQLHRWRRIRIA